MKRLMLFLLVALMLVGCARQPAVQPTESTEEQINELYEENSAVEQQTGGAVRVYGLEDTYHRLSSMGANLLVVGDNGLLVLSGQRGEVIATVDTEGLPSATVIDTAATGMAYYVPDTRQIIVRNPLLQINTQLQLPENIEGEPRISLAKNEVYYSVGSEIRGMNISTGISRLVRQQSSVSGQKLLGDYFGGSVLKRVFAENAGDPQWDYISTETGASLGSAEGVLRLDTHGTKYAAAFEDGPVTQIAFGERGQADARRFYIPEPTENGGLVPVLAMNGMVGYEISDGKLVASFYELQTGIRSAEVKIDEIVRPAQIHSDGRYIWILCADRLYRWDIAKSPSPDSKLYTAPLYTAQQPDTEGLAQCQALADAMSAQYGVKLLIWQNAVEKTGEYTVTAEHHTHIIMSMLEQLQPILAQFPEKFLQSTIKNGWIRIALVREIDGPFGCVQFWEDGDSYILLSNQSEKNVLEKITPAIISHVRGNSRDLDEDRWIPLNPEGFAYTGNNSDLEKPEYLEGENRAFTDNLAMSYPYEDQSRVLYYAMQADNGEMFQSPILQEKLMRVCMGIREAYRLTKSTETFLWEQYLQTSLAYVGS